VAAGSRGLITTALGKRLALAGCVVVPFVSGLALPFVARLGEMAFVGTSFVSGYLGLFLLFAWVQYDRRELGVPRSAGFNAALVWFALIAAPVYFLRHRAPGRRWQPLLGLFVFGVLGWNVLLAAGLVAGGLTHYFIHGPA
jgi:hypothetical protein